MLLAGTGATCDEPESCNGDWDDPVELARLYATEMESADLVACDDCTDDLPTGTRTAVATLLVPGMAASTVGTRLRRATGVPAKG